jgi:hypothetical protein
MGAHYDNLVKVQGWSNHWPLNELAGSTVTDYITGTANGTIHGGVTLATAGCPIFGIQDGCAAMNGTTGYIDVGTLGAMNISKLSVSIWFKTTSTARMQPVGNYEGGSGTNPVFQLDLNRGTTTPQAGYITLFKRLSSSTTDLSGYINVGSTLYDGLWHNLAATFDSASNAIVAIFDGAIKSVTYTKQQTSVSSLGMARPLYLGGLNNIGTPDIFFNGALSRVSVANTVKTSANIADLYAAARAPNPLYLMRRRNAMMRRAG